MNIIPKSVIIIFTIILCTNIIACSNENDDNDTTSYTIDDWPDAYEYLGEDGKFVDILRCASTSGGVLDNIRQFTGVRNGHLWFALYINGDPNSKIYEWESPEPFDYSRKMYLGYGESIEFDVTRINVIYFQKTISGFIAEMSFQNERPLREYGFTPSVNQVMFVNNEKITSPINNISPIRTWYEDSELFYNSDSKHYTVYSSNGTVICNFENYEYDISDFIPISYEEGIRYYFNNYYNEQFFRASRINCKTQKELWTVNYKIPFTVQSNTKSKCILSDKSTNTWKFKLDFLYYDGTKKNHELYLDIDMGEILDFK